MNMFSVRLSKTTLVLFAAALLLYFLHPLLGAALFGCGVLVEAIALFSAARDARRQANVERPK